MELTFLQTFDMHSPCSLAVLPAHFSSSTVLMFTALKLHESLKLEYHI